MSVDYIIYFALLAFIAEILGTVGGFGSSLFFVPIAGYFLDFHSVLGITALFHLTSNISKIALFRNGFDKKLLLTVGIPAVLFVIVGAYFSKMFESSFLEIGLAIFLIVLSAIFLYFKNLQLKPNLTNSLIGGALSGFMAGLLGTGGAIRGLTLSAFKLKMELFIATSAMIDLAIDSSRSVVYFFNGYLHRHDMYLIPILFVVSLAGTFVGKRILTKMSEQQFRMIVLFLILGTGISSLVKVIVNG